jgi:hypothetical protein
MHHIRGISRCHENGTQTPQNIPENPFGKFSIRNHTVYVVALGIEVPNII